MSESDILLHLPPFWVAKTQFGTGRFKPRSEGFEVLKEGATHSTIITRIGFSGEKGFHMAKEIAVTKFIETQL